MLQLHFAGSVLRLDSEFSKNEKIAVTAADTSCEPFHTPHLEIGEIQEQKLQVDTSMEPASILGGWRYADLLYPSFFE